MWNLVGNETQTERAKLDEMLASVKAFLSDIVAGNPPRWLSLLGNPGCGKTHLSDRARWFLRDNGEKLYNRHVRAAIDPLAKDVESIYSYAQEGAVMAKWGTIISRAREGDFGLFNRAANDHFKVIDDLGVDSMDREGRATPFATQKMSELLDRRTGKWTIITSNFTRKQFAEIFDSRISSRLMRNDSVIVDCSGVRDFNIRREQLRRAA